MDTPAANDDPDISDQSEEPDSDVKETNNSTKPAYAIALKELREAADLSYNKIDTESKNSKVYGSLMWRLENGKKHPATLKPEQIKGIAHLLKIPVHTLADALDIALPKSLREESEATSGDATHSSQNYQNNFVTLWVFDALYSYEMTVQQFPSISLESRGLEPERTIPVTVRDNMLMDSETRLEYPEGTLLFCHELEQGQVADEECVIFAKATIADTEQYLVYYESAQEYVTLSKAGERPVVVSRLDIVPIAVCLYDSRPHPKALKYLGK
jgi:hypothetical protein